ncbi:hypothetical protein [Haloarcula japonica]|uniref:hypothetical protein n=1 Tax=Haloarcula japonica TaxID=29282 RepID=UPI000A7D6C65|nr:hypothetical protein [Haloarcula japonica]
MTKRRYGVSVRNHPASNATGGQISIEGTVQEIPEGGVVRVHPDRVRNLCNHIDEIHV